MIGNFLKVITAIVLGYLVGLLCGGAIGFLLGLVLNFLFDKIVLSNQAVVINLLLLSAVLGGLLGLSVVQIFNKLFATSDNPLIGLLFGAIFGSVFIVFEYGILDMSSSSPFSQYLYSGAIIYSSALGSQIGALIYSVFGTVATVREIVKQYKKVGEINWYEKRNELP